jgi:hypothetical protein
MALTVEEIREAKSDRMLFDVLSAELQRWVPNRIELDDLVVLLPKLPPGLRAMSATFQFDVSMCLDDIGWHFANWHHRPYCLETSRGLHELEATVAADVFDHAFRLVDPFWDSIGELLDNDFDAFVAWYRDSTLEKSLEPLNRRFWDTFSRGLEPFWVDYARKYPERMLGQTRRDQ